MTIPVILTSIWENTTFTTIFISVMSALGGAVVLDLYLHFKNKTKKAIDKHKQEKTEEYKAIVVPCITEAIQPLNDKLSDVEKKVDTIADTDLPQLKQANRDSLRNQLFASYRHCAKLGYRSVEDTTN